MVRISPFTYSLLTFAKCCTMTAKNPPTIPSFINLDTGIVMFCTMDDLFEISDPTNCSFTKCKP